MQGGFFIIWRNYTDRMSSYGIPFTHNAFPSWRQSVRGHIACLQGELFRAEKKLQWLSVHVGWGWGPPAGAVSTRWREICHMHSLNWGLCRLLSRLLENPAHKVVRAKTVQKRTSRKLCHGMWLAGNFQVVLYSQTNISMMICIKLIIHLVCCIGHLVMAVICLCPR